MTELGVGEKLKVGELAAREADAKRSAFDKGATGPTLETSIGASPKFADVRGPRLMKFGLKLIAITQPSG